MDLREVASVYQSIYLNEEVEEELILEDLSQDEVDELVEEIIDEFLEEGFSLEEIEQGFEDYISEESEVLNEARRAKRQPGASQGPKQPKKSLMQSQREKLAAQRAAKKAENVAKVEADKAALVVRPSDKISTSAKKVVAKKEKAKGTGGLLGSRNVPSRKSLGAAPKPEWGPGAKNKSSLPKMPKKQRALPASRSAAENRKKEAVSKAETAAKGTKNIGPATPVSGTKGKGALPATRSATSGEKRRADAEAKKASAAKGSTNIGPAIPTKGTAKAEVKSGVRKAMTYRSKGTGRKEFIGKKEKVVQVNPSAKKAQDTRAAAMAADKEQDRLNQPKATSRVKSAVKSGVKKARNFVGSALSKLADKIKTEGVELDSFDTVIAYLIDEQIVSDYDEAIQKMTKLSEETIAKIHASQLQLLDGDK